LRRWPLRICEISLLTPRDRALMQPHGQWPRERRGCMTMKTNKLLWDENGQIGCELPSHAPYKGSDTWRSRRWRAISAAEAEAFERGVGYAPACETCASIARRAEEQARAQLDTLVARQGDSDGRLIELGAGAVGFFFAGALRLTGTPSELLPRMQAYFA